jgi:hypothetical protein
LRDLPDGFSLGAFEHAGQLSTLLPRLLEEAASLAQILGQEPPLTSAAIDFAARIGERVAAAPDASPETFLANEWEGGVERAGDLASAVAILEAARAEIGSKLSDGAWSMDLRPARTTFAEHGTGFLKVFSGEWRKANRLVRSVLTNPQTPHPEVLSLLDVVARARTALETIRADEQFGRTMFGSDWRGERSTSAALVALVDWMRTLRGLGAEPRVVAARRPDRSEIGHRAVRVRMLLTEAKPALLAVWGGLADRTALLFGKALSAENAELAGASRELGRVHLAHSLCGRIMTPVPTSLPDCRRVLEHLARGQVAAQAVSEGEVLGSAAFRGEWRSTLSDWSALRIAADWIEANRDIRMLASRVPDRAAVLQRADATVAGGANLLADFDVLLDELRCDRAEAFGHHELTSLPLQKVVDHIAAWLPQTENNDV